MARLAVDVFLPNFSKKTTVLHLKKIPCTNLVRLVRIILYGPCTKGTQITLYGTLYEEPWVRGGKREGWKEVKMGGTDGSWLALTLPLAVRLRLDVVLDSAGCIFG